MRLGRVRTEEGVFLARLEDEVAVLLAEESTHPGADVLREALAGGLDLAGDGDVAPVSDVRLLAPVVRPSKVVAIGLNYADHAREAGVEVPPAPLLFAKTPNAVVGPGEEVCWRSSDSDQVDYEAELAVVVGRTASQVTRDPREHVLGYTCANDVSARNAQFGDGQWTRGKSFDGFCPLGPWIVTADELPDPQALRVTCEVSGELLQDGSTKDMIFGVDELIRYITRFITLLPGDVIATGTPWGVGFARTPPRFLTDGDTMTVRVEGIGELTNPCRVLD